MLIYYAKFVDPAEKSNISAKSKNNSKYFVACLSVAQMGSNREK